MNAHWKLIFSLKRSTVHFLKSFFKNETSKMSFVSKNQVQCSFSNCPKQFFVCFVLTTFDWYQPLKTKRQLPKDICYTEPQPVWVLWFSAPAAYLQALLEAKCVAMEQQHCNLYHRVSAGSGCEIACFKELHYSSDHWKELSATHTNLCCPSARLVWIIQSGTAGRSI